MKSLKYYLMALAGIAMLNACSDDDPVPGNPTMDFQAEPSSALFGDSLPFTIKASDADVPPFHVKSAVILQRRNGVRDYNPYKSKRSRLYRENICSLSGKYSQRNSYIEVHSAEHQFHNYRKKAMTWR